jgi:hypothetical protein
MSDKDVKIQELKDELTIYRFVVFMELAGIIYLAWRVL